MRLVSQMQGSYFGLLFDSKESLSSYVATETLPLTIAMPCGNIYVIESVKDVPVKTTVCDCGNMKEWVVVYRNDLPVGLDSLRLMKKSSDK